MRESNLTGQCWYQLPHSATTPTHKFTSRPPMLRNLSLRWCYNERGGVSNHPTHDCLFNRLFRRRSKKKSKLRVTGFYEGNSPVTREFSAQRASNRENASIWWRHHVLVLFIEWSSRDHKVRKDKIKQTSDLPFIRSPLGTRRRNIYPDSHLSGSMLLVHWKAAYKSAHKVTLTTSERLNGNIQIINTELAIFIILPSCYYIQVSWVQKQFVTVTRQTLSWVYTSYIR